MKVTAITKFKQGDLWHLLKKLGWSQSELARRSGVNTTEIGRVINLKFRPSLGVAEKIQVALAEAGEFLDILEIWPETFQGFSRGASIEQTQEIEPENLVGLGEAMQIAYEPAADPDTELLEPCKSVLTKREAAVISKRFDDGETLDEVGSKYLVSRERIRQIERKALRKMGEKMKFLKASEY